MQVLPLGVLLVVGCVVVALLGLLLVRRFIPLETLQEHNEVAGFLIPIVGIAYAVLLAFVVIAVWGRYEAADSNVDKEADEVATIYRLAAGLPESDRVKIQDLSRSYISTVIDEEWPAMAKGRASPKAAGLTSQLWQTYAHMEPQTNKQVTVYAESLTHMTELAASRRLRLHTLRGSVPAVIWVVLVVGGAITVAFTYFFGVRSLRSQMLMTALVTTAIAVSFFLVVALNNPFQGSVRINPSAFRQSSEVFRVENGR